MPGKFTTTHSFRWGLGGLFENAAIRFAVDHPWLHTLWELAVWFLRHPRFTGTVALALWLRVHLGSWAAVTHFLMWSLVLPLTATLATAVLVPFFRRPAWRVYLRSQRKRSLKGMWPVICEAKGLMRKGDREPIPLKQVRAKGTHNAITAVAYPGYGALTTEDVIAAARNIAASIACRSVFVRELNDPGVCLLTCIFGDSLDRIIELLDLPMAPLGTIGFGVQEDGTASYLDPYLSVLVGGRTGSGKSRFIWNYLVGLQRAGIPYQLRVIDPAGGVELHYLAYPNCPQTIAYTYLPTEAETVLIGFHDSMMNYLSQIPKGTSQHVITDAMPLQILIIDEFLLLGKTLTDGVLAPFGETLAVGRKAAHVVIALSQNTEKEVLGPIRDLFAQRVCFAVNTPENTDTVLGGAARSRGAEPHRIPRSHKGMGYYAHEDGEIMRFRTAKISDKQTLHIAKGMLPTGMQDSPGATWVPSTGKRAKTGRKTGKYGIFQRATWQEVASDGFPNDKPTTLYRFFDQDNNELLYVGIAYDHVAREYQEANTFWWWDLHPRKHKTVAIYPTRQEALDAEKAAIHAEHPKYNIEHNGRVVRVIEGEVVSERR